MAAQRTGKTGTRKQNSTRYEEKADREAKNLQEPESFLKEEISIILLFVFCIVLFISNFKIGGAAGEYIRSIQLGVFGVIGYLLPFIILFMGVLIISNKGDIRAGIKTGAGIGAVLCTCGLIHTLFGKDFVSMESITEYYLSASGGGAVGGILVAAIGALVGKTGATLVLLAGLIISAVCLSEKSFVGLVKREGDRAYRSMKNDLGRRIRERSKEAKERKLRKEEEYEYDPDGEEEEEYDDGDYEEEEYEYLESVGIERRSPQRVASEIDFSSTRLTDFSDRLIRDEEKKLASILTEIERKRESFSPGDSIEGREKEGEDFEGEILLGEFPSFSSRHEEREGEETAKKAPAIEESEDKRSRSKNSFSTPEESILAGGSDIFTGTILKDFDSVSEVPQEKDALDEETLKRANEILSRKQSILIFEEGEEEEAQEGRTKRNREESSREEDGEEGAGERSQRKDPIRPRSPEYSIIRNERESEITLPDRFEEEDFFEEEGRSEEAGPYADGKEHPVKPPEQERGYRFPPLSILNKVRQKAAGSDTEYRKTALKLQQTLHNFGVEVSLGEISRGPTVTRYELHPRQGVKVSKIVSLADDIKLSLAASDIRIEAPIPGKPAVGIEVPNSENTLVCLRELFESEEFRHSSHMLKFALGKDIGGKTIVADIAKMPHLLIAGATGSGKSVCINTLIMSILYSYSPDEVRLIMIDPKVVELSVYKGIPHLLIPVVSDAKKAAAALNWAVAEMTDRYKKFAEAGVRDLRGYNEKMGKNPQKEEGGKLPKIIIIIDELADLMMVAQNEVEDAICRLAQLARACGIHLVIATQRPSVNVITGLIKANIPSRIAFAVSSGVDSKTILDGVGAEKLLGRGDMLFSTQSAPKPIRVQGAFVSDKEVQDVVDFLASNNKAAKFDEETAAFLTESEEVPTYRRESERDELFAQVGRFIIEKEKASIGNLQRVFKIGFNRAARIMDQLAESGVVGEEQGTKSRQILMSSEEFERLLKD